MTAKLQTTLRPEQFYIMYLSDINDTDNFLLIKIKHIEWINCIGTQFPLLFHKKLCLCSIIQFIFEKKGIICQVPNGLMIYFIYTFLYLWHGWYNLWLGICLSSLKCSCKCITFSKMKCYLHLSKLIHDFGLDLSHENKHVYT